LGLTCRFSSGSLGLINININVLALPFSFLNCLSPFNNWLTFCGFLKIKKMKNYNNNLQQQKIFLELTKEHTVNDKDFHINIFKNLIKNISEKMSSK